MTVVDVAIASSPFPAPPCPGGSSSRQAGAIRGSVSDKEFSTPLAGVEVLILENGRKTTSTEQGHFVLEQVPAGKYTLVFSKYGYARQVQADVVVAEGSLAGVDVALGGEFTDMEEFVVQDVLQAGAGTEAEMLQLRFESAALMDSISADLMSRAGASDAAGALRLVAGASVQDGKTAVIRGLPDRYVSSQMNGVRLPTADEDKRAVELDQYPSAVIESIQVAKTFTPDQQGDASGGAVNVRLKGIPHESIFQIKAERSANSQVRGRGDFLTYDGGGVNTWGRDDGDRDMQLDKLGSSWDGSVGTSTESAPIDYKWSGAFGGRHELENGITLGAFVSVFYERDSSFYADGEDNSLWVETPGGPLVPQTYQGTPADGDFKTGLFDVTRGSQSVQWGGLATVGAETENHSVDLTYLYTHIAEDTATLAIDTRGKEYFFPGYDPDDPTGIGNTPTDLNAAPYIRFDTLEYTERTTGTLQLGGHSKFQIPECEIDGIFKLLPPELDWIGALSSADLDQPDKRQFGALWLPESLHPGAPPFIPPFSTPPTWYPYKPGANFTLGNLQRIWKTIEEDSQQYAANLKLPFEQWSGDQGYFKTGLFSDQVDRRFDQDTFSNFNDNSSFVGDFDDPWVDTFPSENHPITASTFDVDYKGEQDIAAWYSMLDLPLVSGFDVIGGARFESTKLSIVNSAEPDATWFPPGAVAPVKLNPGDADVDFTQHDVLPSIGVVLEPYEHLTLRSSWSKTVARQTFKELSPILQQEFLGGPIFIGNPDLQMSSSRNWDVRADYAPYEGGLFSASWFRKDIDDPIEYVQRFVGFTYTTPVNYPKGRLEGYELEVRQGLGQFWDPLTGLALGANATFLNSDVTLPDDESAGFDLPNIQVPMSHRDMTNAPDHLYNLYLTYDLAATDTQFAVFYTVQGDTLVAGAGQSNGNFVPSVYATEYETLNVSLSQRLGQYFKVQLQAKNLTNPRIREVYRSSVTPGDVTKTSYTKGVEYSFALGAEFRF